MKFLHVCKQTFLTEIIPDFFYKNKAAQTMCLKVGEGV